MVIQLQLVAYYGSWNGSVLGQKVTIGTARYRLGAGTSSPNTLSIAFGGGPGGKTDTEEWSFPPATASTLQEGQMWFNSSSSTLKGYGTAAGIPAATWASGGNLNKHWKR